MNNVVILGGRRGVKARAPIPRRDRPSAFDELTATLLLERFRQGTLDEGVLVAFMAVVGLEPPHGT